MKKLTGIAVLLTAIVINAFASPTGGITDNLFVMTQDDYMSPQWYPRADFEKFFAATSFGSQGSSANLGFATKAGGLYIGVLYSGNIFNQVDIGYTETKAPFFGGAEETFKTYGDVEKDIRYGDRPYHNINVLLGAADMGFRLGFSSDYQLFEVKEDAVLDNKPVKSAKIEYGRLSPSFTWAMARDLTPKGIRPSIGLSLGFDINSTEREEYSSPSATKDNYINTDNSTSISLSSNLGGYILKETENGFTISVDFSYYFSTTFYGENQYSWENVFTNKYDTEKKNGRFENTNTGTVFTTDIVDSSHKITPSLKIVWDSPKAGIGAKLYLPVSISHSGDTKYSMDNYTGTYIEYQKLDSSSSIGVFFSPYLVLGSQIRLVPDKFNINVGAAIDLSSIGQRETETEDSVKDTSSKRVDASTGGTDSYFRVGATLFLTKNISLDAYTGVTSDRSFTITGTASSLTTFQQILLSLKF